MPAHNKICATPEWLPAKLQQSARSATLNIGEAVFVQGSRPESVDFVQSGEIHLLRYTPGGGNILLHRSCGGFIAEASIDASNYHCDAIAVSVTTLLRFDREQFKAALDSSADFCKAWRLMLAHEIRRLRSHCERLALHTAQARIAHYIACEGQHGVLELSSTLKSWALELGLSHEALYRELSRLKAQGLIRMDGKQLIWLATN
jgi:CRP-like cAMP-binding protein